MQVAAQRGGRCRSDDSDAAGAMRRRVTHREKPEVLYTIDDVIYVKRDEGNGGVRLRVETHLQSRSSQKKRAGMLQSMLQGLRHVPGALGKMRATAPAIEP